MIDDSDMLPVNLTPAAEADLKAIARYTFKNWGSAQAKRYAEQLDRTFTDIADDRSFSRSFSTRYPQLRVAKCQKHFIFYLHDSASKPLVVAVLHERMNMLVRLANRLAPS